MESIIGRHSRDESLSRSSIATPTVLDDQEENSERPFSYVQSLRRARATVWSDQGRAKPLQSASSWKSSSQNGKKDSSKGLGGMRSRVFSSQHHGVYHTRPASLKSRTMAPQHTILTPRLSATEGKDEDEDDPALFAANTTPTYMSMINSSRASSTRSGTAPSAPSIMGMSIHSQADTTQSDGYESRSGSPTHDIQSYLVHHSSGEEDSDWESGEEGVKRLVITNVANDSELDSD
ncbi:uncharacterized protein SOCG_03902 [Schizosaccharomyces octosporus yFS286]|uniref:Uncharacterized protein n=1 Tax=Schizosaccharomyces octosporus (strain yFS286) TaxID=483514 RepID=S9PWX3_SCHOY|nr:uncharacterized protein SOCG_03902 [Schizosaccharomyces octosporus yFS286]EPX71968.1 hypothetical protein SOCG_03902 [Schizosaccharomyces octosporus yFS286]